MGHRGISDSLCLRPVLNVPQVCARDRHPEGPRQSEAWLGERLRVEPGPRQWTRPRLLLAATVQKRISILVRQTGSARDAPVRRAFVVLEAEKAASFSF